MNNNLRITLSDGHQKMYDYRQRGEGLWETIDENGNRDLKSGTALLGVIARLNRHLEQSDKNYVELKIYLGEQK